ncbi:reverse transcriptase domain-containing protein, partial [Tanacetum coccineum]
MRTRSQSREQRPPPPEGPPVVIEPLRIEYPFQEDPTVEPMADTRTMAQLLQAPTEGYEDAILIPEIVANNFELKHGLINLVQNKQFFGHDKEDPHAHIRYFNKITSTMRVPNVPIATIKLMLFPFSIEGAARIWLEKEPPRSIQTWDDLVSKFINQFFPPSKTTNLRNEITRFQQRFDESFYEAWDRFNDLLRACPHHGFSELHQLDTFYNALNINDQDSLNSAAGGNFLDKMPRECLKIIESKSKVRQTRAKAVVAKANFENEHCSAGHLEQVTQKLEVPRQVPVSLSNFQGWMNALGIRISGASINSMPFSVGNSSLLSFSNLHDTRTCGSACDEYSHEGSWFYDIFARWKFHRIMILLLLLLLYLTPFGDSDFLLLEEADSSLGLADDSGNAIFDCEPPSPLHSKGNFPPGSPNELKSMHFWSGDIKLPSLLLKCWMMRKNRYSKSAMSHKRALVGILSDIQGINPEFCNTDSYGSRFAPDGSNIKEELNPKNPRCIKKEVEKTSRSWIDLPYSRQSWVSPIHCVPKMGGMSGSERGNELIPNRFGFPDGGLMDDFSVLLGNFFSKLPLPFRTNASKVVKTTNLSLNWEKSHFLVKEGIVIGHKISKKGLRLTSKNRSIAKFTSSTTSKELGDAKARLSDGVLSPPEFDFKVIGFTKGAEYLQPISVQIGNRSGYHQKDRKTSQNDKTEHGMEKTVQNQGQSPKMPKRESKGQGAVGFESLKDFAQLGFLDIGARVSVVKFEALSPAFLIPPEHHIPLWPILGVLQIGIRAKVIENQLPIRPYLLIRMDHHEAPPLSPAYVPDPMELDEHVPVYVPEPEHPEYHIPTDDDIQVEDQPYADDASPTAESPGHIADSKSMEEDSIDYPDEPEDDDEDLEEGPKEDHTDYPADEEDGDDEPSDDDDDDDDTDDEDEEPTVDEEEEEHLAPVDPSVVPVVDHVPSARDTEAFETDEYAPTPRPPQTRVPFSQTRLRKAWKTVRLEPPMSASMEARIAKHAAAPIQPTSLAYDQTPLGHRAAMIRMRDDIPEEGMPPQRRFVLIAPPPGRDVAESSAAAAARPPRAANRAEDVGYVRALQDSE